MAVIQTPLTKLFGIKHPILLAGMNVAAGPELAAAVTNAGGLGVIGILRQQIHAIKKDLKDPNAPFGVDLLLPQVGGNARKTNVSLFVSAVGVPPKEIVDKLHAAGIPVMNMVGHPKHVKKALDVGCDLICAQAGEGGGHTGDIPASILIPACVDAVKGHTSKLNGQPIYVIGAGAIYDGRGLAANLAWGAQAVWVGTRFVASVEAGAPKLHKELVVSAGFEDAITTLIYTGRPLRVRKTPYIEDWELNRQAEIKELTAKGVLPHEHELSQHPEKSVQGRPWLMGRVSALIHDVLPAKVIVESMVNDAAEIIQRNASLVKVSTKTKL
ncbi:hypothetical protein BDQ17DRAFT_1362815 [Cyathus striatus]|nr:hypothetical protein BDQ17DRAFT_1362815 [Cyathus striatus]